jgi:hypothetical protein
MERRLRVRPDAELGERVQQGLGGHGPHSRDANAFVANAGRRDTQRGQKCDPLPRNVIGLDQVSPALELEQGVVHLFWSDASVEEGHHIFGRTHTVHQRQHIRDRPTLESHMLPLAEQHHLLSVDDDGTQIRTKERPAHRGSARHRAHSLVRAKSSYIAFASIHRAREGEP